MELPSRYHWLPDALLDVSRTLPPVQNVVGPPGVIVGVAGIGLTVTVVAAEGALVQPLAVAGNVLLVAPTMGLPSRYHWLPDALLEVRVTLPPVQNVVGPPGVIVGVAGIGLTVTVVAAEAALVQPLAVTVTV